MPLGLVCAALLLLAPLPPEDVRRPDRTEWRGLLEGDVRGLAMLVVSAILHTVTVTGFCAFLPLMLCSERGFAVTAAGDMLAWFILSGSAGVLVGGYLSDRIGRWWTILFAYLFAVPLLFGFLMTRGLTAQGLLMGAGMALWTALPCTITLAQELTPRASGIASGMVMGFAWGIGALVLPVFGMIADRAGKAYTMHWIALLPLAATLALVVMKRVSRNPHL
jgi:FSR family fosmidomycin resistance protein-like MFS transporter